MVDSEYSMNIYKSVKINIGTVMKNPEILKLKKCVKMQLKKLPFLIRYVPDQYKIQQMCAKAILENGGTLKAVPDCHKNQQLHDKAVDNYPHALEFVSECYKAQESCVIKLLILIFLQLNMFPINLRLKKCVIKPLMIFYQY